MAEEVIFDHCFDRRKTEPIMQFIDPSLREIERLAGKKFIFPEIVECMSIEEIWSGMKVGAGHGLLTVEIETKKRHVKVNPFMDPINILANVVHENLHLAFPEKHETEIDELTNVVLRNVLG